MDVYIFIVYTALALCGSAAFFLVTAFIALITKKHKIERLMGILALIADVLSFSIYYYLRIIISSGGLSDWRVVFTVSVYIVAGILSILSAIDGNKKLKSLRTV